MSKKENKKPRTPVAVHLTVFMVLVTALVFLPATIVVLVCMLPTVVAAIVDGHPQKTAWVTVGSMNLAGTMPTLFALWDAGPTIPTALQLISHPAAVLLSYGAAGIGWVIYYNVTPFVAAMVVGKNERRLKEIGKSQKELVKKWGEEVVSG